MGTRAKIPSDDHAILFIKSVYTEPNRFILPVSWAIHASVDPKILENFSKKTGFSDLSQPKIINFQKMTRLHQTTTYENYRGMLSIKQLVKLGGWAIELGNLWHPGVTDSGSTKGLIKQWTVDAQQQKMQVLGAFS